MPSDKTQDITKSNQEQAVASWINYLNQVRLDRLLSTLHTQNGNLEQALQTLDNTFAMIRDEIIIRNRGGIKGMHGFIAEVAECGIGNARNEILGKAPVYEWINDNGPADLLRNGIPIQQKFVNAGNHLSLQAIKQHLISYPWFIEQGGKYQIPEDHYERIKYLLSLSPEQANKMPTETGDFSLKQWREVHSFFEKGDVKLSDIEPSKLSYKSVQPQVIESTISDEKKSIRETDKAIRDKAYSQSKPTMQEGLRAGAVSAAIEGGMTFTISIRSKIKQRKSIKNLTSEDWSDILKDTGIGTVKGGVRGISIYAMTNFTATPAAVASSLVTASFGIAHQVFLLNAGKITQDEFILNSEILCVDVSVSALSSFIGQAVIPIPVVGAVIGNTIGNLIYQAAKDYIKKADRKRIENYLCDIKTMAHDLDNQYRRYVEQLNVLLNEYFSILDIAFAVDSRQALQGSIQLAEFVGVNNDEILRTGSDIDNYFLN